MDKQDQGACAVIKRPRASRISIICQLSRSVTQSASCVASIASRC